MRPAVPPVEKIATSAIASATLQIVHHGVISILINPLKSYHSLENIAQNIKGLLFASPVLGRSPPADSALLSA